MLQCSWNIFRVWPPALQVMRRLYLGYVELDRKLFSVTIGWSEEKTASTRKKTYLEEGRVWVKLKSEKVHPRQQSRSDNRLRAARSPPRAAGKRSTLSVPVPSVPLWGPGFKETIKPCPLTSTPRVYCAVSFPSIDGRDKVALVLHRQKDREKQLCSKLLSAFTFPK